MHDPPDEFDWIEALRPLTRGDPRALALADDAAVMSGRTGFDLVVSKDAMVESVHFSRSEDAGTVARRLLRTSLSDLAAKAAEPFGYLLMTAWPNDRAWPWRQSFIEGLRLDGEAFNLSLLGGDTVATPGPLTLCATVLGWTPEGATVLRSGAKPGDLLLVCGTIGDGGLGLAASRGEIDDPDGRLAERYRLPRPLLTLRAALRDHAHAAADVSDGLLADAAHIAQASGLALTVDVELLPHSPEVRAWLGRQPDPQAARVALATGGDDYAIVCAVEPSTQPAFMRAVMAQGLPVASVGYFEAGDGLAVNAGGAPIGVGRLGWRH